ncbi:MAG TPA: hypothetical protein VG146_15765 [Verrucomicrobiae bacterium]|nr:hypothetical protein [Verrucomicrobiae bacterium]
MKKIRLLAIAGLFALPAVRAATFTESFSTNPLQNGWQVFGQTNLFKWDSVGQNLAVTWDSAQTNSCFYHPLGTILARDDDFSVAFDLRLNDFMAGVDPQMPSTFPLSVGLLNLAQASQPGFLRGTGYNSPDLVEFAFFPDPGGSWIYGPSLTAVISDATGFNYASGGYAPDSLTTNDLYRVNLAYTASNSNLVMTILRNNQMFVSNCIATLGASFTDFRVDAISISSYSQAGQDTTIYTNADGSTIIYAGSLLAHGVADNFVLTLPTPPVQNLTGALSDGLWQAQFTSRSNWLYTLERTTDFVSWTDVSLAASGNGANLVLQDTNAPASQGFYRVRAQRP